MPKPDFSETIAAYRFYESIGAKRKSAHVKKMDEISSLQYNLLSDRDWDKLLCGPFDVGVLIKETFSRNQALLYDVFSTGRRFPDFDFHDMAYRVF